MDSISFYKAKGSTSSRVPSGSCCRPPMRFAFTQANPACPAVCMSHWFSKQLLVLNDTYLNISLFNLKIFVPLYPVPEVNGFYGQDDKAAAVKRCSIKNQYQSIEGKQDPEHDIPN
jgi:hypothetical protein